MAPRLDNQNTSLFGQTPSQTVGPFFHYALPWHGGADLVGASGLGSRADLFPEAHDILARSDAKDIADTDAIEIFGQVRDGEGAGVGDALIEIWQADASGSYDARARKDANRRPFIGFGRCATDAEGGYGFRTVRPGAIETPLGRLAPHVAISVLGRGLLKRLVTRLYFADAEENVGDPVLALVAQDRRHTLTAQREQGRWRFDIVLQGADETVFFDI